MKTDEEIYWMYKDALDKLQEGKSVDGSFAYARDGHYAACVSVSQELERLEKADVVAQAVGRHTHKMLAHR